MGNAHITQPPLLELDLLRTLVAISDTGNFSAAADVVFRTPSAVSMQVKKAEEMIGRPLFHRDSRSVSATLDGETLIQHGRRMLALNHEMVMQFIEPTVSGTVRLGAPYDMVERALPDLLRRFAETHCCVTVDVVVDSSANLQDKMHRGELDLAIITCDPKGCLPDNLEIIFRERLAWAGARNGLASQKTPVPVSVWEEGCSWRNAGIKSLEKIEKDYRIAFMSAHISGQRAALLADLAIAPLPASQCINGIMELTEKHGFPALEEYALGLLVAEPASKPVEAAADHLRESVSSEYGPALSCH